MSICISQTQHAHDTLRVPEKAIPNGHWPASGQPSPSRTTTRSTQAPKCWSTLDSITLVLFVRCCGQARTITITRFDYNNTFSTSTHANNFALCYFMRLMPSFSYDEINHLRATGLSLLPQTSKMSHVTHDMLSYILRRISGLVVEYIVAKDTHEKLAHS